jgi:hypothetical protein
MHVSLLEMNAPKNIHCGLICILVEFIENNKMVSKGPSRRKDCYLIIGSAKVARKV